MVIFSFSSFETRMTATSCVSFSLMGTWRINEKSSPSCSVTTLIKSTFLSRFRSRLLTAVFSSLRVFSNSSMVFDFWKISSTAYRSRLSPGSPSPSGSFSDWLKEGILWRLMARMTIAIGLNFIILVFALM